MGNGKCYHHPSQDAVATCRGCGKGICRDCYDVYGVTSGEYAGKALCYDCTSQLVAENVINIDAFRERVKSERKWMIIGAIIGLVIGGCIGISMGHPVNSLFCGSFGIFVGASLATIVKMILGVLFGHDKSDSVTSALFIAICLIVVSPIITIYRLVKRIIQIKRCDKIIASDSHTLQEMRDYFAYTQAMENNKGVDLAKLIEQGSELSDNTYAQAVLNKGEQAAQAELRQSVVTISKNGEIIKKFDKKKDKKAQ